MSPAVWRELGVLPGLLEEGEYVVEMSLAWNRLPGLLAVTNTRVIFLRKGLLFRSRLRVMSVSLSDIFRVNVMSEPLGTSEVTIELATRTLSFSQLPEGEHVEGLVRAMHPGLG